MSEPRITEPRRTREAPRIPELKTRQEWRDAVALLLSHLNICDQSPAGTQFDSTIQGLTVCGPYGGENSLMPNDIWLSAPLRGKPYGAAAALAFNPLYGDIDPAMMAKLMIVEAVTKLVAAGVSPAEIVLCDNFYTPRVNPEMAWDLKSMVMTCCETALKLGTPFISGKDSSSGTFIGPDGKRLDIPPTLAVLALGRMPDVRNRIPKPWRSANHRLYLAGPLSRYMGGSVYLNTLGQRGDRPADPSLDGLPGFWKSLKSLQESGRIAAASAVSAGGLARRIFEMALGSGFGCVLELSELNRRIEADRAQIGLFAEMTGAMVIEAPAEAGPDLERNLDAVPIGETISDPIITLQTGEMDVDLPVEQLIQIWQKPFREVAL